MRNIYYFARKEDRNIKEKEVKKNVLKYQLFTNKKRSIKRVDESGNECEFPYEIIVYMD
ncbi:hypothetical protein [Thomasclavelia ramosa]|uniref:hypothetical protein n=1 Tax=Thomasclavelia ramosa TaxID=1547 RepID=UPI0022E100E4|nr:hypothetical protein [Thomasclavelia ramosa]